ncbi:MAG: sulfurtransferase complex subunit TusB [bacterium]
MLHTINQSPFRSNTLTTCLRFILPEDPVLFLEDGVYALDERGRFKEVVQNLLKTNPVYGLEPDLKARGIGQLVRNVQQIDYEGFVDLVEKHPVNTWL